MSTKGDVQQECFTTSPPHHLTTSPPRDDRAERPLNSRSVGTKRTSERNGDSRLGRCFAVYTSVVAYSRPASIHALKFGPTGSSRPAAIAPCTKNIQPAQQNRRADGLRIPSTAAPARATAN
jgi:hypothetical protein